MPFGIRPGAPLAPEPSGQSSGRAASALVSHRETRTEAHPVNTKATSPRTARNHVIGRVMFRAVSRQTRSLSFRQRSRPRQAFAPSASLRSYVSTASASRRMAASIWSASSVRRYGIGKNPADRSTARSRAAIETPPSLTLTAAWSLPSRSSSMTSTVGRLHERRSAPEWRAFRWSRLGFGARVTAPPTPP